MTSSINYVTAGYLVDNQQFGTWNGTATSADLVNQNGKIPNSARAVNITLNGTLYYPSTDYTLSGTTVTFTSAPASGAVTNATFYAT